jgi:hypothetical protein
MMPGNIVDSAPHTPSSYEPDGYSSSDSILIFNTVDPPLTARKREASFSPEPPVIKKYQCAPTIDLAGDEFCSTPVDIAEFGLTKDQRDDLLGYSTAQDVCIAFFSLFRMKMTPQVRVDGKRRFCRISINNGEYIFEESLDSPSLGRVVVSLKAIRAFNPDFVTTWLQKYRKISSLTRGYFI